MSYVTRSSADDERVVRHIPLHWLHYAGGIFWTVLLVVAAPFTLGISLIGLLVVWIPIVTIERAITTHRIIHKKGFFNISSDEMQLAAVETVEFEQSFFGQILGYATIKVTGRGVSNLDLKRVPDPYDVKKAIERAEREED
tara:strand:- start:213 stop:635 length:423 start_codon:yes stop_codon:yes gene_type:complete